MKIRKETYERPGSMSINYRTGSRMVVADEVGVKVRISGKCTVCNKPRSLTQKFYGFINNGINPMAYGEAMDNYKAEADAYVKELESGNTKVYCSKCKGELV